MSKKYGSLIFVLSIVFVPLSLKAFCFEEAGRLYGIDPRILWAVAKVESDFNPAALNRNENGSFDYGLMQINSFWYKSLGRDRWMALGNPCYNVKVGAWILAQCIQQHGELWEAVGYYNAKTKSKRDQYVKKVYHVFKSLEKRVK